MFYIHIHRYLNKLNKLYFIDKCKPKHGTAHFVYNVSGMWLIPPTFNWYYMSPHYCPYWITASASWQVIVLPHLLSVYSQELTNPTARMILINARQLSKLSNIYLFYSKKYPESWRCPRAYHLSYSPVTYLWLVPTTLGLTHSIPGILTSLMLLTHSRHASTQVFVLIVPSAWRAFHQIVTMLTPSAPSSLCSNHIFSMKIPLDKWLTTPFPTKLPLG